MHVQLQSKAKQPDISLHIYLIKYLLMMNSFCAMGKPQRALILMKKWREDDHDILQGKGLIHMKKWARGAHFSTSVISLVLLLLVLVLPLPAVLCTTTTSSDRYYKLPHESHASPHYHLFTTETIRSSSGAGAGAVAGSKSVAEKACKATLYPAACESALASASGGAWASNKELFDVSVQFAMERAHSARATAYNLTLSRHRKSGSAGMPTGMDDCLELLDITLEQLSDVMADKGASSHDVTTWLSAALTNQVTCSDSLATVPPSAGRDYLNAQAQSLMQSISNSLALQRSLRLITKGKGHGRKLQSDDGYPAWLSAGDRKLLEASPEEIRADAVVAQDGSGTHRSIGEAIAFVSLSSGGGSRTVIYVTAGTYKENIKIPTKQKNVMIMGDGKGKSVIVSNRNAEDGWSTYQSATVAGMGAGFIAKGLTIINSAGPSKHQAVALRVGADVSVVTQCSIQGYQDTLYTHSNRQFYRDNDIYGTVDFIFGNSAAVFQNCLIVPRRPSGGQKNSITAQGRIDPNQNTGISIHSCKVAGAADLGGTPTYLGRPWHKYARVVFMSTYLDASIHPDGWEEWSGSFALSTLYYGEYANTGPGASTSSRVRWPGVHSSLSTAEASKFTVANFIFGDAWLPATGVDYNAGL